MKAQTMGLVGTGRAMAKLVSLAAVATALLLTGAQARGPKAKKPEGDAKQKAEDRYKQEKTYPTKTTWALRSLNGKPVPADYEVTFMIDDNFRGSGFGGCNYWSATIYPQKEQKLLAGPIAVTKKTCDAARTQTERTFLVGVHSGPAWDTVGSQLTLKTNGLTMVFDRAL